MGAASGHRRPHRGKRRRAAPRHRPQTTRRHQMSEIPLRLRVLHEEAIKVSMTPEGGLAANGWIVTKADKANADAILVLFEIADAADEIVTHDPERLPPEDPSEGASAPRRLFEALEKS